MPNPDTEVVVGANTVPDGTFTETPEVKEPEEETVVDVDSMAEMSDEDFSKNFDAMTAPKESEAEEDPEVEATEEESAEEEPTAEDSEGKAEAEVEEEKPEAEATEEGKVEEEPAELSEEMKSLYAPYTVNGSEFTIDNIEDARTLIQKGAAFDGKARELAEYRKLTSMLENKDLFNAKSLNSMIDLASGDKDAVAAFLKEHKLDPLDIDVDNDNGYTPKDHSVDQREVNLKTALDDLSKSPQYDKLVTTIDSDWDATSQNQLLDKPDLLANLATHMELGVYDQISGVVAQQKMLGKIAQDTPFIDAYRYVGETMEKAGAFSPKPTTDTTDDKSSQQEQAQKLVRDAKRKSASPTRSRAKQGKEQVSVRKLSEMSDEEFMKLYP